MRLRHADAMPRRRQDMLRAADEAAAFRFRAELMRHERQAAAAAEFAMLPVAFATPFQRASCAEPPCQLPRRQASLPAALSLAAIFFSAFGLRRHFAAAFRVFRHFRRRTAMMLSTLLHRDGRQRFRQRFLLSSRFHCADIFAAATFIFGRCHATPTFRYAAPCRWIRFRQLPPAALPMMPMRC